MENEEKEILTLKSKTTLNCKICDRCCKYRGDIRLTPINVVEISKYMKISIKEFLEKYTHKLENQTIEIAIKAIGEERICILNNQENSRCKIHKVKPIQCVMFPLMPVDVERDLFVNMNTCILKNNKKMTVNKWLNGNHNIYKKNKQSNLKWINFIEELEQKWENLTETQKEEIRKVVFENYTQKENYTKKFIENLKLARKIMYT